MENLRWTGLSVDERNELLSRGGIGALSFSTPVDEPPVLLPVSYGYDADTTSFYFRLAFPTDSRKTGVVDGPVAFTTYAETEAGWRSVVARGRLEEVTDMPYESSAVQGMWAVRIPMVDLFDRPPEDVAFRYFRLRPDSLTGRKEVRN